MNELAMNPDREMLEQALVLGLLVKGRTVLEDFSWTPASQTFAEFLKTCGLRFELKGHQLVLEGTGFEYTFPTIIPAGFSENATALLMALASRDTETVFTVTGTPEERAEAKTILNECFVIQEESSTENDFSFRFSEKKRPLKETSFGNIPYLPKNAALLRALLEGDSLSLTEHTPVRDQWSRLLAYFGVSLTIDSGADTAEMDEFEKRLAKMRGIKQERLVRTELKETKIITSRDYFVPGDTTEAAAFTTLWVLAPVQKGSKILLKNAGLNSGRAGFFPALKRMGALVEVTSRRERYGDVFGNVEVERGKRLTARHLSGDTLGNSLEEYPFLALAACMAEGESILRVPDAETERFKTLFELLAVNLRKTGADIGVYEEGLVIRGREECDGGEFDCGNYPAAGLAFFILSLFAKGSSTIQGLEYVERAFPGVCNKLKGALGK
ncbi:MAG: 3-phosphoshikimate 1-carboxyvinyltransferase [Fibrobacter sp.]|jgi:5-enolpyruvylshikimate-3-phosphate synthase|nr:3-phosphoshikimate 1-carboxyvinyltransferase [Fibrobacter sp.]